MDDLSTKIVSALVGAIVAAIGFAINNALSQRAKIDENLLKERLKVYKILWEKTEIIPKWPKATNVTYGKLHALSTDLRDWYFREGGIYLSADARKAYEYVQEYLCKTVEANQGKDTTNISDKEYKVLRTYCSVLRTELTHDLQSRKRIFLAAD